MRSFKFFNGIVINTHGMATWIFANHHANQRNYIVESDFFQKFGDFLTFHRRRGTITVLTFTYNGFVIDRNNWDIFLNTHVNETNNFLEMEGPIRIQWLNFT